MSSSPNIVIVVLDSVRRDHLSLYGYERPTTPSIDEIAKSGLAFQNAYSASSWTIPSHASLFTGLYPSFHRADFDTRYLDDRHPTLASLASAAGYRTACFTANGFISSHTNLDRGFGESVDIRRPGPFQTGRLGRVSRGLYRRWSDAVGKDRGSARLTRLASRWMRGAAGGSPFLLFLNYMDCHLPYRLRTPDRYRFVESRNRDRADAVTQDPFGIMARGQTLSETDLQDLRDLYDGALFYLDRQIGRLDGELTRLGLAEDTVLIITADHGESFGEHGLLDHQYGLWEHLIAVPLIARIPGEAQPGRELHHLVQLTDIMPSAMEWIGGAVSEAVRRATVPLLADAPRSHVFSEYLVPNLHTLRRRVPGADVSRYDHSYRSVRDERHKLVLRGDGVARLYDLHEDPGETTDVKDGSGEIVRSLRERLEAELGPWPDVQEAPDSTDVDPALRERLEALGYL